MPMKRIINRWVRESPWFKEGELSDCEKFLSDIPHGLKIVNLGSNSAKFAFLYDDLPIRAFNFAMGPQCLRMDLKIFQCYKKYLHPSAVVFIPLCPFSSMAGYNYDIDTKYHLILPEECVPNFLKKTKLRLQKLNDNPVSAYPLMRLFIDVKNFFIRKRNSIDYDSNATQWINSWKTEFNILELNASISNENTKNKIDSASILSELISECKLFGCKPYVVMPPIFESLSSKMIEEMREAYIYNYLKLAGVDDNEFLNYIDYKDITTNKSMFRNAYFLNDTGAKYFTHILLSDLNLI